MGRSSAGGGTGGGLAGQAGQPQPAPMMGQGAFAQRQGGQNPMNFDNYGQYRDNFQMQNAPKIGAGQQGLFQDVRAFQQGAQPGQGGYRDFMQANPQANLTQQQYQGLRGANAAGLNFQQYQNQAGPQPPQNPMGPQPPSVPPGHPLYQQMRQQMQNTMGMTDRLFNQGAADRLGAERPGTSILGQNQAMNQNQLQNLMGQIDPSNPMYRRILQMMRSAQNPAGNAYGNVAGGPPPGVGDDGGGSGGM